MTLTWFVGNRNPSITETITSDGAPVDLSSSTVRFRMRPVGSSTLKVDQPATIVNATAGSVRYDWAAPDVDTAGEYLVWWQVTTGGKTQDMNEALIVFVSHASDLHSYVELEQLKESLSLAGKLYADRDIRDSAWAASRAIEQVCGRRFWADSDALQVRYFEPISDRLVRIDDLVTLTSVGTDPDGDGVYDIAWTLGSDFELAPLNAATDGKPYESLRRVAGGRYHFAAGDWLSDFARNLNESATPKVKVTGKWGWLSVPPQITEATKILANTLTVRKRDAPLGVMVAGMDVGVAARIARNDPQVMMLTEGLIRGSGPSGMGLF